MLKTNFTAELVCTTPNYQGRVGLSDGGIVFTAERDGWLIIDRRRKEIGFSPVRFLFAFKEAQPGRLLYDISCATDFSGLKDGLLGFSANGYAGIYGNTLTDTVLSHVSPLYWALSKRATVEHWKIESLSDWDGTRDGAEQVDMYLRSHEGYRLGGHDGYLNITQGDNLTFRFKDIREA